MSLEQFANSPSSTLNGGINSAVTSLIVTSAASFSSVPQFRIIVDSEIMFVTGVSGTTFTVTRGQEGTSAASHTGGAVVTQILTKAGMAQYRTDLTGFINVKNDYGAKGDGATDDTTAISNALSAANATPGVTVGFPPGTYICNTVLTMAGVKVSMVSIGGQVILKKKAGVTSDIFRITGTYCRVTDIEFDGSSVVGGGSGCGILGDHNVVDKCFAYNCGGHGFYIDGQATTGSNNTIRDCFSGTNSGIGYSMNTAKDNLITGCQSVANQLEGITIDVTSYRNRVIGNWVQGNCIAASAANISIDGGDWSMVIGNTVRTSQSGGLGGIVCINNAGTSNYVVIANNVVEANSGRGIWLAQGTGGVTTNCTVNGNILYNNTHANAIQIDAGCNNNAVVCNCLVAKALVNSGTNNQVANNAA